MTIWTFGEKSASLFHMHKTKPHYYMEPYAHSLEATVSALDTYNRRPAVILDQTICYPEGGGQPGDRGNLDRIPIVDTVSDKEGRILHILGEKHVLGIGEKVTVTIDWSHRYDFMQQHTAQHLLSGFLHRLLHVGTVSVHLGHDDLSIELHTASFSDEDAETIEDAVNAEIRKSTAVTTFEVSQEESVDLGLRRPVKVEGDIRIVQIGDADMIACGGVHVGNTSELLHISFLRTERIRGRVKTFWVAGDRSISLRRRNQRIVENVGTLLSLPPEAIPEGIVALQDQLADVRYEARQLSLQLAGLKLSQGVASSPTVSGLPLVTMDVSDWGEQEFKALPETFFSIPKLLLCVVRERSDGKLAWMLVAKGIEDEVALFQRVRNNALPIIEGKGGGKPPLWQGVGNLAKRKDDFLEQVSSLFRGYVDGKAL